MHHKRWTRAEDMTIINGWGELSQRAMMENVPSRTWPAIRARARVLRLPFGIPQGFESVTKAAKRSGFSPSQIRKILKDAKVMITKRISCKTYCKSHKMYYVDPVEVDAAVRSFLESTSVQSFCNRNGLKPRTVIRAAVKAGIEYAFPSYKRYSESDLRSLKIRKQDDILSRRRSAETIVAEMWGHHPIGEICAAAGITQSSLYDIKKTLRPAHPPHMVTIGSLLFGARSDRVSAVRADVIRNAPKELWWCAPRFDCSKSTGRTKNLPGFCFVLYVSRDILSWIAEREQQSGNAGRKTGKNLKAA